MKKHFITALLLIFLIVPFGFAAPAPEAGSPESAAPAEAGEPDFSDPRVLQDLIENGKKDYILVDVRTPEEYGSGHIPTAENIPVDEIESTQPADDKDALIILYCRSGNRSGRALSILEEQGYSNVHNFGGIEKWKGGVIGE